jgi:uncharacterized membrane protein
METTVDKIRIGAGNIIRKERVIIDLINLSLQYFLFLFLFFSRKYYETDKIYNIKIESLKLAATMIYSFVQLILFSSVSYVLSQKNLHYFCLRCDVSIIMLTFVSFTFLSS